MARQFIILIFSWISFPSMGQVEKITAIAITVSEMERSVIFYKEVLGFKRVSETVHQGKAIEKLYGLKGVHLKIVRMQLGDEYIDLVDHLTNDGRPVPENLRSNDLSFQHIAIVVSDMDSAYRKLERYRVKHVSVTPQTIPPDNIAAAGIRAYYFRDPDNHPLELIYFPKGKGHQKWQQSGSLFLGIDHTAISIRQTLTSHKFYHNALGIPKKGETFNQGKEQAALNNVEGATLHISGYRATAGPGVEFLEYLYPGPGTPYPADSWPNDLWHWQTIMQVQNIKKVHAALKKNGYRILSDRLIKFSGPGGKTGYTFIVRDPDGHAIQLIQCKQ